MSILVRWWVGGRKLQRNLTWLWNICFYSFLLIYQWMNYNKIYVQQLILKYSCTIKFLKSFTVLCIRNRQCEQIGTLSSLPLIVESRYPSILKTIPKVRLIISCLLRKRKKIVFINNSVWCDNISMICL